MKTLTALCFITGIILAGSDGNLFPWVNILGAGIFALIVPLSARWRG